MKKILSTLLSILAIISVAVCNTSCKNPYKGTLPGEVRLNENDYRHDDKIQGIVIATPSDTTIISALEMRSIWHSIIIEAEKNFEYSSPGVRNTYESTDAATESFYSQLHSSLINFQSYYPDSYQAIIDELTRAQAYVYAKYIWCKKGEDYIDMKFTAKPSIPETNSEITEK